MSKFYRFSNGIFVKAASFELAKEYLIKEIQDEKEDPKNWHNCTCLGLSHRHDCPEMKGTITY